MGWEGFMKMERDKLRERRQGKLRRALGVPLPGESSEQLHRIAQRDRLRAAQGLIALKGEDGAIYYKYLDNLGKRDMEFVTAAERVEATWLRERVERMRKGGDAPPVPPHLRPNLERR
jgi:hypothetical protein